MLWVNVSSPDDMVSATTQVCATTFNNAQDLPGWHVVYSFASGSRTPDICLQIAFNVTSSTSNLKYRTMGTTGVFGSWTEIAHEEI